MVTKFQNDPTVEESEIVVLLEQVLDVYGKRESSVRGTFLPPHTLSQKFQRWVSVKLSLEPHVKIS